MKKLFATGFIVLTLATTTLSAGVPLHVAHAADDAPCTDFSSCFKNGFAPALQAVKAAGCIISSSSCIEQGVEKALLVVPGWIAAYVLLPLVGWITTLSGLVLNFVINETVVGMASKLADTPSGIGGAINQTWTTARDIANMFFIFVLLYTAIMTMFGKADYKRTILNMIIAAILINFSLFFTKVVIDFGNLIALMFYKAITAGQLPGNSAFDTGISNALMDQLHITSIWKNVGVINGTKLLTVGVMGSIFALIAAFVFFAVAIMFVIRFVVLIFVLILSPLMFVSFILPGSKKVAGQWRDALLGQTFFAPIYFFLTWIVIKLGQGLFTSMNLSGTTFSSALGGSYGANGQFNAPVSTFGIVLNFVLMIAFLILSLTISKSYANRAGSLVAGATKWATGFAGGATLGMAGRFGRGTVGKAGQMVADSNYLKDKLEKGGAGGVAARLAMATGRRTAGASFDVRAAGGLGKTLDAGKPQKGGYAQDLKDKKKREDEFTKSQDATQEEKERAKETRARLTSQQEAGRRQRELDANRASMTPEEVRKAEAEIAKLNTKARLDPTSVREYNNQKTRNEAMAKDLEERADNKETAYRANKDSMSEQETYNAEQEIGQLRSQAKERRQNTSSHLAYVDSILGLKGGKDGDIDKRKKALNDEEKNITNAAEKDAATETENDPAAIAEKKAKEKVDDLEKEIRKKETDIANTTIPEFAKQKKEELGARKKDLDAAKEELEAAGKTAEERRKIINDNLELKKKRIHSEYEAQRDAIKEVKNIGDRRKEAHEQGLETGWVPGKVGQKIEGYAARLDESKEAGRAARTAATAMRTAARMISHKNRAAAAELRKGKKSPRELFDEAVKAAGGGETPPPAPEAGGGAPAGEGGGTGTPTP